MSTEPALVVNTLSKSFGHLKVLRKASARFNAGEVVLLLGANGAGKSTLLRIIAGLAKPDSGSVSNTFAGRTGFAAHTLLLYSRLTVRENLRLFSDVAGQGDPELQIRSWDLTTVADTQVSELSKGNQARVSLARAMLAEPSVVLLDEPSSNLDERGTRVLVDAISSAHERHEGRFLAVIATHDIHRLRDIATRVMVLEKGVLAADSGTASTKDAIDAVIDAYREANR